MTNRDKSSLPPMPSERRFGEFFSMVFVLAGGYGLYAAMPMGVVVLLFALAAVFLILAMLRPKVLAPLNKAWFAFGALLGRIVSPIVLGAIFFLLLTPVAFVSRAFGRDELKLKRRNIHSYWINRDPVGPKSESFKNQF